MSAVSAGACIASTFACTEAKRDQENFGSELSSRDFESYREILGNLKLCDWNAMSLSKTEQVIFSGLSSFRVLKIMGKLNRHFLS